MTTDRSDSSDKSCVFLCDYFADLLETRRKTEAFSGVFGRTG